MDFLYHKIDNKHSPMELTRFAYKPNTLIMMRCFYYGNTIFISLAAMATTARIEAINAILTLTGKAIAPKPTREKIT